MSRRTPKRKLVKMSRRTADAHQTLRASPRRTKLESKLGKILERGSIGKEPRGYGEMKKQSVLSKARLTPNGTPMVSTLYNSSHKPSTCRPSLPQSSSKNHKDQRSKSKPSISFDISQMQATIDKDRLGSSAKVKGPTGTPQQWDTAEKLSCKELRRSAKREFTHEAPPPALAHSATVQRLDPTSYQSSARIPAGSFSGHVNLQRLKSLCIVTNDDVKSQPSARSLSWQPPQCLETLSHENGSDFSSTCKQNFQNLIAPIITRQFVYRSNYHDKKLMDKQNAEWLQNNSKANSKYRSQSASASRGGLGASQWRPPRNKINQSNIN